MLSIRNLNENDYETFVDWWRFWRFPAPTREMLPANGLNGFVVKHDDVDVCGGFLYFTNSNMCWLEYIVSNYEVRDRQIRKESIELLINTLLDYAKTSGFSVVYTSLKNENLKNKFENCGFIEADRPIEMVKRI